MNYNTFNTVAERTVGGSNSGMKALGKQNEFAPHIGDAAIPV